MLHFEFGRGPTARAVNHESCICLYHSYAAHVRIVVRHTFTFVFRGVCTPQRIYASAEEQLVLHIFEQKDELVAAAKVAREALRASGAWVDIDRLEDGSITKKARRSGGRAGLRPIVLQRLHELYPKWFEKPWQRW